MSADESGALVVAIDRAFGFGYRAFLSPRLTLLLDVPSEPRVALVEAQDVPLPVLLTPGETGIDI